MRPTRFLPRACLNAGATPAKNAAPGPPKSPRRRVSNRRLRRGFLRRILAIGLTLSLFLLAGDRWQPNPMAQVILDRPVIQRMIRAVVQLTAVDVGKNNRIIPKWGGSGTIISADGLILTNCHVVLPEAMIDDPRLTYDHLVVSLTTRSDQPPNPTYQAEVVQCDPELDLAVIRIVKEVDGTPIDPSQLDLPAVPLGDSDQVELGDPLFVFGYPGIGGETITFTSGNVSGFTRQRGVTGRAWIKTDATITGGNSGGAAINLNGDLIGVPTRVGVSDKTVDCRPVADTNGDGTLDEKDSCVPIGGFINALRPVNLAEPLIEAAGRGLEGVPPQPESRPRPRSKSTRPEPTPEEPEEEEVPQKDAYISRLIFAPAVNEHNQPTTIVDSFPSGTEAIYLLFDYNKFEDGTPWFAEMIYENGTYTETWPVQGWEGGPQGNWWINYGGKLLDDGTYEFTIYYDDIPLGSATVEVGGPEQDLPTFRDIEFAGGGESGYLLPAGIQTVEASFKYANMTEDTEWSAVWYYEGKDFTWDDGQPLPRAAGTASVTWEAWDEREGFAPGSYRLELYIEDRLAATADFVIAGEEQPKNVEDQVEEEDSGVGWQPFGPITFASQLGRDDEPLDPGTSFPSGIRTIYAIFDYQGMRDGWEWGWRWFLDGELVINRRDTWNDGERGENLFVTIHSRRSALPDGEYELELLVRGQVVQSGKAIIGSGRGERPPAPPPRMRGVEVYGYITDVDTGRGIPNAIFLVLKPGITTWEFRGEEDIYSYGVTDRRGYYELSVPLTRGEYYSIIIRADGYWIIEEDDILVGEDLESPLQVDIQLQRIR